MLQVDEDGAVGSTFAQGPVVDANEQGLYVLGSGRLRTARSSVVALVGMARCDRSRADGRAGSCPDLRVRANLNQDLASPSHSTKLAEEPLRLFRASCGRSGIEARSAVA